MNPAGRATPERAAAPAHGPGPRPARGRRLAAHLRRQADRWLLAGAALALGLGFLNPGLPWQRGLSHQVVVLDITQSMNVLDQRLDGRPASRLAFAKRQLRDGLLALPCGSRVGWAIFTEYRSYLLLAPVEVCANLDALRSTLDGIDGRMAWVGGSEVAKGLHSALGIARQLSDKPALVFVTDGHESPPLHPRHRPAFDDKPGEVPGLLVGVGGLEPLPIPKTDPGGRPLGVWRADEVAQFDLRSQGRGASVTGEKMVDDPTQAAAPALGSTPGSEHLSALRETYLRLLAAELGLGYHPLADVPGLLAALQAPALLRPQPVRADARVPLAVLAGLLLLARCWPARPRRAPPRRSGRGGPA